MKKRDFSKEYDEENLKLKQIHYVPDKQLLKRRKSLSEHPFGIVKRDMGADYVLLKRICGETAEMAFTYLAFNMKRAINLLAARVQRHRALQKLAKNRKHTCKYRITII